MNSILDDLFKGNINIMEILSFRPSAPTPDRAEFMKTLTTEQQEVYDEIRDAIMVECAQENRDCFVIGFSMAVKMMIEALTNSFQKD